MSLLTKSEKLRETSVAQCYLLDSELCVIGAYHDADARTLGASFFDLFPANRIVREEIVSYVRSFASEALLTLCARTPVLFLGGIAAQTGLVLAVVPKEALKKTLSFPAAFHRVPACVQVSPSAQIRYKAHDEAAFADASRWLRTVGTLLTFPQEEMTGLAALLSASAERLSAFFGVPLFADLSGIALCFAEGTEPAFGVGVLLAALTAARRSALEHGVGVYAAMEGCPVLYLEYSDTSDALSEFQPLLACAKARGVSLATQLSCEKPYRVRVRAPLGVVQLSDQGLRQEPSFPSMPHVLDTLCENASHRVPFAELFLD